MNIGGSGLQWPTREHWESTIGAECGSGLYPSCHIKDYANPDEIAQALKGLTEAGRKLFRAGRMEERKCLMYFRRCLHGEVYLGFDIEIEKLDTFDDLLPPVVLAILARYARAVRLADKAYALATSDEAWADELRRHQRIESKL
jgi:hypothetical protein